MTDIGKSAIDVTRIVGKKILENTFPGLYG